MRLVCPVCQAEFPLEAALNDVAARQAVVKAFELTEMGSLLIRYTALFKPAKQALSMSKLAKMLEELVPMVKAGQITRGGTLYPAPQSYWQQAIETMLANRDNLALPLKTHGYVLEIIASYANKASAQQERKQEQGRKYGDYHQAGSAPGVVANAIPNKTAVPVLKKVKAVAPINVRDQLKKLNK